MSSTSASKKQKKSKITFDRLLLIKKNILESLSFFSKHDRPPTSVERNNTVPKDKSKTIYRKIKNDECESLISKSPKFTPGSIEQANLGEIAPRADIIHATSLGMYQTWPHDEFSAQLFQEEFPCVTSNNVRFPTIQRHCTDNNHEDDFVSHYKHTGDHSISNCRSVKNQEIQTDFSDVPDVNADIRKYLNQFNDKIAFSIHAPNRLRKSSGFIPCYGEHDYSNFRDRIDGLLDGRFHRQPEMCISLARRDQYSHGFSKGYQQGHTPLVYQMPQKQNRPWKSNEQQNHRCDKSKLKADTLPGQLSPHGCNLLAPPCIDTNVVSADDSGSILSSESDTDFIFYPSSSLTQNFKCMTLEDSRSTSFLSPPSDLPECINANFSWRSDFYGSSLDEVTLQFFLDDDALSDDVFVDDHELMSSVTNYQLANKRCQNEPETRPISNHFEVYNKTGYNPSLGEEMGFSESYGDNCYAYRYADIDEVLQSYTFRSQETAPSTDKDDINNKASLGTDTAVGIPLSVEEIDVQSTRDDPHLELKCDLSNVFDSLRRNSTQAKARKMWRLRRAKRRKAPDPSHSDSIKGQHQKSLYQPSMFTFDHICLMKHNPDGPTTKPVRGILKNKTCTTSIEWDHGLQPHHTNNNHSNVDVSKNGDALFTFSAHSQSNPESPSSYDALQKQFSTGVRDSLNGSLDNAKDMPSLTMNTQEQNSATISDSKNKLPHAVDQHSYKEDHEKVNLSPNYTNEQFHIILIPDSGGSSREIVAVRKSSLETYEWTRSLQRRQNRLVRKANGGHEDLQSKNKCNIPQHQYGKAPAVSV